MNERFTSRAAREERRNLVAEILADRKPPDVTIEEALDEVRRLAGDPRVPPLLAGAG